MIGTALSLCVPNIVLARNKCTTIFVNCPQRNIPTRKPSKKAIETVRCLRENQQGLDPRRWAGAWYSYPPLLCALPGARGWKGERPVSGSLLLGSEMPPMGFRR